MKKVKGSPHHLRREISPVFWPIPRKKYVWAVKPSPGPHPISMSIPLGIILRDALRYAETMREARRILGERKIAVDGRVVTDYKFPVGIMDVISILPTDEHYRLLPHPVKVITLHPIDKEEAIYKLVRIKRKTTVKGGNIQLTFHDGRNYLVRVKDPFQPVEDVYSTYDTVKINIPEQEVMEHFKMQEGNVAITIGGSNIGFLGKIKSINRIFKKARALVTLESDDGKEARTILEYVFVIGKDKPAISLPKEVV
ncbi:MAG: 30S ribosomal protein S4e [Thermoprotei archaeon]|nr:MAG: 30S ribosomal protein S4e [Thermoprotei archaeon]